jgi:hypothetical protein
MWEKVPTQYKESNKTHTHTQKGKKKSYKNKPEIQ